MTLDNEPNGADAGNDPVAVINAPPATGTEASVTETPAKTPTRRRRAASRPAGPPQVEAAPGLAAEGAAPVVAPPDPPTGGTDVAVEPAPPRPVRKRASRKKAVAPVEVAPVEVAPVEVAPVEVAPVETVATEAAPVS